LRFEPTALEGVFVVQLEIKEDDRGFFARTFCRSTFEDMGLDPAIHQCSISHNRRNGTLRGMHFQRAPHAETRLVRCTAGAIFDVVLDLRPESETFRKWTSVELTRENFKMMYVPKGCAHGFQTLRNDTDVFYQMSDPFSQNSATGVRWDDPAFGIEWPAVETRTISEKDRSWPDFSEATFRRP
jgi:dTDP-4-dehydrorhamnose 3,5-epimerase